MEFRTIDPVQDREIILAFRKDSYVVSFGSEEGFGDEEAYISRIAERVLKFPDGQVLVLEQDRVIGQLELQIKEIDGCMIGYANLFYLAPGERNKGRGRVLIDYAEAFFRRYGMREYQLRVSPDNARALALYTKAGLKKLRLEREVNPVWRMSKNLD